MCQQTDVHSSSSKIVQGLYLKTVQLLKSASNMA